MLQYRWILILLLVVGVTQVLQAQEAEELQFGTDSSSTGEELYPDKIFNFEAVQFDDSTSYVLQESVDGTTNTSVASNLLMPIVLTGLLGSFLFLLFTQRGR